MLVPRRKDFELFEDMFNDSFWNTNANKIMKTDILEQDNQFELLIDLPGFQKEDIKMNVEDGYLIVQAKTSKDRNEKNSAGKFVRQERYYGECSRNFYLGENIIEEEIKATFKNGTLQIIIPKKEKQILPPEKRYIEIED